jgi:hypothetical protein
MTQQQIEDFILAMSGVQSSTAFGYRFFFYADNHKLPFATLADSDNEYDNRSNLNRDGVFRVNAGVSAETFRQLFEIGHQSEPDYTVLNRFLPHPDYAAYHFICILCPTGENALQLQRYLEEAYAIARARYERRLSGTADANDVR